MPIRCARRWALLIALAAGTSAVATPDDTLLPEIEQRLERGSVDAVNAHLTAAWTVSMVPLQRRTADCELAAVSLSLRLARGMHTRAVQAHTEALRAAAGRCPRYLIALAQPRQIADVCASLPSWSPAHTARELRRRMAAIEADELLRSSRSGQACRAAYRYELEHTRVVVRSAPPRP